MGSAAAVQRETDELNIRFGAQLRRLVNGNVPGVGVRKGGIKMTL